MLKKMGEAVARVARKVNETVESGSDTLDLAECKLVSFPIGIYKVLRNVSGQIHLITLANNELKSLTSKFMTTFSQLRELHLEGNFLHRLPSEVSALQHLKAIDLSRNQFQDFPEQLTALPALETINLEENEIVGEQGGLEDSRSNLRTSPGNCFSQDRCARGEAGRHASLAQHQPPLQPTQRRGARDRPAAHQV
ncbi:leucine-rich repeat-containing protein 20 isoform X2 [Symphalangus syndactylus]|uniref:leucine-rich repeat-containing protein 20 isoform X2 n=1 Tax=Symphalangus syndactylus TaxID=9590 RepID=UPI0024429A51|nr:leucine-rich repeat-containing protein 20 isoform X1 [Symphalangus syndactylus]XP_055130550.1 leucine-rich repeat-containing protein 20 isoform X1 [Symphalangus syndactylus]XP_055130551.1 leucine-rich repeat-containing protein 20 isoform X1 [Symphalangus syndactylus]XP_055130552.1 leucine-rich repeat-containing protein 20 isoform X1 [Symphalangus syndactylus]